ncbi:MAG: hypothetical protein AABX13_03230 [Nanoarchaeota archaeon]
MKEHLDLEEVLKYDPYRTYLGYGYLDDSITCSNTHFFLEEPKGITTNLSFKRSFLAESEQGFHLSAMNVQVVVPFLCQQLVKAQLTRQNATLEDFLIISSEQHYKQFIDQQEGLRCRIEQIYQRRHEYQFEYGFYAVGEDELSASQSAVSTLPSIQPAFSGTMTFAVKVDNLASASYLLPTLQIQSEEKYKLKEVYFSEEYLSIEGLLVPKTKRLAPVQVHGAIGLLMKGLFCRLLRIDRQKTMDARAYTIIQQYDRRPPQEKRLPISLQLDREMHLSTKKGEEWGFFTAHYELGETMQGMLRIAQPMNDVGEREKMLLRKYFEVRTKEG